MIALMPNLRAFAISLCGNVTRADDLVQETLLRAIANQAQFQPGTSLGAWLSTILRNYYRTEYRKRRREVEDPEAAIADSPQFARDGESAAIMRLDWMKALQRLDRLPRPQREALLLVLVGFKYEEAGRVAGCKEGTVKSRANRARAVLINFLEGYNVRGV